VFGVEDEHHRRSAANPKNCRASFSFPLIEHIQLQTFKEQIFEIDFHNRKAK
jgi:hypothetical protein